MVFQNFGTNWTGRKSTFQFHLVYQELDVKKVHVPNFGGLSGSEGRGGGDNSIQFINFGRVCDKCFKEWRQKIGGWKGE